MQSKISWKNLFLLSLLLLLFVYALPNIFGDDPAIQISMTRSGNYSHESDGISDTGVSSTYEAVKNVLDKNKIHYKNVEKVTGAEESSANNNNEPDKSKAEGALLIRFFDTDSQLIAKDKISDVLGDKYVVALNLASQTPAWLKALGAHPMKLGLDLRGGVHFLLDVNTDALAGARSDGDLKSVSETLRQNNIRYTRMNRKSSKVFEIFFRDEATLDVAQSELKSRFAEYTFEKIIPANEKNEKLDVIKSNNSNGAGVQDGVVGEYRLAMSMTEAGFLKVADYAIDQTISIMQNRVNELGVSEAIVQRQGARHVSVDLPGIQDTVRAKEIIGKTATLKFYMVDSDVDTEKAVRGGEVPFGDRLYDYDGRKIILKDTIVLQGNSITYAAAGLSYEGRPSVNVRLGGGGESMFHKVTAENIGKQMAVVYSETKPVKKLINGKEDTVSVTEERIISVATIQTALGNNFEITGLGSDAYAKDLSLLLRSGALVAPVNIVQELTIGPSMGKNNINKGLISIIAGFVFVVIFMMCYYRLFGLIANVALLVNLVFVVAILSILGATLTLPGIAGMVLTVGMAVDSNVIIYERIREELRNGSNAFMSIGAGYDRALTTIVDANVATLIVAIVLFALGSGAVKGFAITLTIGLMTSMLTAIVLTRSLVDFIYIDSNNRKAKGRKLSIGIKYGIASDKK